MPRESDSTLAKYCQARAFFNLRVGSLESTLHVSVRKAEVKQLLNHFVGPFSALRLLFGVPFSLCCGYSRRLGSIRCEWVEQASSSLLAAAAPLQAMLVVTTGLLRLMSLTATSASER